MGGSLHRVLESKNVMRRQTRLQKEQYDYRKWVAGTEKYDGKERETTKDNM